MLTRAVPLEPREGDRHRRRSGAAGDLQQPVHGDRRGDGGRAASDRDQSVNIKERLDFSCAIFDADGALIANAPHIPVHLGSMGESIRTIIDTRGQGRDGRGIRRGDAYVLNDPYRGGTHLPDITVIVPVFYGDEGEPSAFVAARGHHADIGGIAPGSMPPDSQSHRRGRRADRQCAARRRGTLPRGGDARAAWRRANGRRAIPTATFPT